ATLRAERKPSGSARTAATAVPSSAISTVLSAPASAAGSTRRSGGIMRRMKSRIHGTPRASLTGSAPVSQTSHARTTRAVKIAARVIGAGAMRPAWAEGGLREARAGSGRLLDRARSASPASRSVSVDHSRDRRRDAGRRAVEGHAPLTEADDARGVGQRGLELVLAHHEREAVLDVDRLENVHDAAG